MLIARSWMTEKYAGNRVFWDGRSLITKHGTALTIPSSLRAQLPTVPFEGVL